MFRRILALLAAGALLLGLSACGSADPVGSSTTDSPGAAGELVIGSQQYYSNEIIAELYAQALEAEGYQVTREYQIGQREVYLPEMAAGRIDLLPEYNGNLLQYYDKQATARSPEEVTAALADVLPAGIRPLDMAEATDQDSYTVTRATADQYGLAEIGDLAKLTPPVKIGANSEFVTRPYGIPGLRDVYGVEGVVVPIEDSGSALTVKALVDGDVQVADIYTASPAIQLNNLVSLADPKALILPQNIVPIASDAVDERAADIINAVSAKLGIADLIAMNTRSVNEQLSSSQIATDWLQEKGLL